MYTEENLRLTSKIADEAELEHDLEVWRQAYNAAIASNCESEAQLDWGNVADKALADYRAKREEMGKR